MSATPVSYQKLFESSPLARLVVERVHKDQFFVLSANKSAVKYFCPTKGKSNEKIDNINLYDFLDSANTNHILQALEVCYTSKVAITIQVIPKFSKEMKVQFFMLSPVLDDNNSVMLIDMQARPPATEQASIERERDDAISMFTTVFDVIDVGITVTDHHGRFVRINDAFTKHTGWEAIDLMGEELTKINPPDRYELAWNRHKEALRDKKNNFGEIVILRSDGSEMNVMATSVMMELSNGRSFRITTIVDVTELKRIELDLRRAKDEADGANMAKSAFLANMSHELRTPLNAIIGFSEMMMNGTLGVIENDHYIEYLGDIKFSAQHLLQIINDVLDMSKIEAGKMPLDDEDINLVGLLDSVRRLMATRAKENNITIEIVADDDAPHLLGDERLVRQVFLNLLSNAVKFSKPSDTITLKISLDNGVRVDVIDHGIGIPQDRIDEVIEPFGQVVDPRLNTGQGTGLGLPIAKAMMDMHGGKLNIQSEKNKGTVVTCLFPENRVIDG